MTSEKWLKRPCQINLIQDLPETCQRQGQRKGARAASLSSTNPLSSEGKEPSAEELLSLPPAVLRLHLQQNHLVLTGTQASKQPDYTNTFIHQQQPQWGGWSMILHAQERMGATMPPMDHCPICRLQSPLIYPRPLPDC